MMTDEEKLRAHVDQIINMRKAEKELGFQRGEMSAMVTAEAIDRLIEYLSLLQNRLEQLEK